MQKIALKVGMILALFAVVATGLVSLTELATREQITVNEHTAVLAAIDAVIDERLYNNDILTDTLTLPPKTLGNDKASIVYRARMNDDPVAVVLNVTSPNGYSGKIKLLVGINYAGILTGVRAVSHKETPGLGDKINENKSDWIMQFSGLSLQNTAQSAWGVKKDGGAFDAFTGATITPRAVVLAVKQALIYFNKKRDALFAIEALREKT